MDRYKQAFLDNLFDTITRKPDDVRNSETYDEYVSKVYERYDFRCALVQLYGLDLINDLDENCRLQAFYNDTKKEVNDGK